VKPNLNINPSKSIPYNLTVKDLNSIGPISLGEK